MPDAAEIILLVLELDNRNDFRKSFDALDEGIFHHLAEAFCKAEELRRRQILIAKEDHAVIEPRLANGCDDVVARLGGKIDAQNFRADGAGQRSDFETVARHFRRSSPNSFL